ncbi:MAG: hypothetical protein HW410_1519 [Nitrosarchaeum sp.]|nr:hypothetical protein [Nitrosarchaeum sp.]
MSENRRESWRDQYELAWKIFDKENSRFWTRFNISLGINAGLLAGLFTMLSFSDSNNITIIVSVGISIMGIVFAMIWLELTSLAQTWTRHYADVVKSLEANIENEDYRLIPPKGKIPHSITSITRYYPITFVIFWTVLTGLIVIL